jgi:hypothetical protein
MRKVFSREETSIATGLDAGRGARGGDDAMGEGR